MNTGASDDFARAIPAAHEQAAWVHVDGAFGLWAAASPRKAHLVAGVEGADSWGTDAHKWLNVPYDSGLAFCADPHAHATPCPTPPPTSPGRARRLRARRPDPGVVSAGPWVRCLGRVARARPQRRRRPGRPVLRARRPVCRPAREGGATIHNDVVLNQVLVGFDDLTKTDAIIEAVQRDGTCWLGGTTWQGKRLIRISVSNWSTTQDDIDRSADAILASARRDGA